MYCTILSNTMAPYGDLSGPLNGNNPYQLKIFKICFNIILPSTARSPKWYHTFMLFD